jgi:hypothetical protein
MLDPILQRIGLQWNASKLLRWSRGLNVELFVDLRPHVCRVMRSVVVLEIGHVLEVVEGKLLRHSLN